MNQAYYTESNRGDCIEAGLARIDRLGFKFQGLSVPGPKLGSSCPSYNTPIFGSPVPTN